MVAKTPSPAGVGVLGGVGRRNAARGEGQGEGGGQPGQVLHRVILLLRWDIFGSGAQDSKPARET